MKVVLITGAARRIGAVTARLLHACHFNVAIHYHTSGKEAKQLVAELNAIRPHSAMMMSADLACSNECKQLIQTVYEEWQQLDALVNNASRFYPTNIFQSEEKQQQQNWQDLFQVNLYAPLYLSQLAYPYLKATKGNILNITDVHVAQPMKEYGIYSLTKAGLHHLTLVLAKEFAPDIRVNAIAPGSIIWPEHENQLSNEQKNKIIARTALKQPGHPDNIAKAVKYLIEDALYVTGEVIHVDGGRRLFSY